MQMLGNRRIKTLAETVEALKQKNIEHRLPIKNLIKEYPEDMTCELTCGQPNDDPNKVRGLKNGILERNRDTGMPMHVLPNQSLLFKGDTNCY